MVHKENIDFDRLYRLVANSTYQELGLRAREYLQYQHLHNEEQNLAEITLYNCMVSLLQDLGMKQEQAEAYCEDSDRLTELAQYISSILG